MNSLETWLPIVVNSRPDLNGLYSASSLGRIRSDKNRRNRGHGIIIKQFPGTSGYMGTCLCASGKPMSVMVHRLIARAFIPNPENKPQVNHKNGVRTDNRVENLEWATNGENNQHAYDFLGRKAACGERSGKSKLTEKEVREIRAWWKTGDVTQVSLSKAYGIHVAGIGQICLRKAWKHVA